MEKHMEVERSLIKKYRKSIWNQFIGGIKDYQLIQEHDKIAVCISGGKDSLALLVFLAELKKYNYHEFDVSYNFHHQLLFLSFL